MTTFHDSIEVADSEAVTDRYLVVSSDMHIGPSVQHKLRSYCDAKHLPDFDEYLSELRYQPKNRSAVPVLSPKLHHQRRNELAELVTDDPHVRTRHMDEDGIAAEIIYHGAQNGEPIPFSSTGLLTWSSAKYDHLEPVGIRIYNRWLADFISVDPVRHIGVAHIPIHDVDAAVREVEWARSAGLTAINLPAPRRDFPGYHSPVWEPFWAACAANEMVLNTHAAGGDIYPYDGPARTLLFLIEGTFISRRGLWQMILTGVFARHPRLKFVVAEQYSDWVTDLLTDLDSLYHSEFMEGLEDVLPEHPREYWQRNCFIGSSFMSNREAHMAVDIGADDKVMWGADYPHIEGTWPRSMDSLRYAFHDVPTGSVRKMLGENAIDVYGLDRKRLSAIAAKIGPSVAEVATPLVHPTSAIRGFAFRERGKFS